jgi:Domain of unknown function (DUF4055)
MEKKKGVRATHPDYDWMFQRWQRCKDVVEGQDAIHRAGELYLPRLIEETDEGYKARKGRADFFNATWRTIAGLTGMAFRKEPAITMPAAMDAYTDDITMTGVTLDSLARELVEDVLQYGRMGLLVDHPPVNVVPANKAAAEQQGLRPALKLYEAVHIRNWKYAYINNRWTLVMVVLAEQAGISDGEFAEKIEARFRVLDLDENGQYRQRVFRINDRDEDELVEGPVYPMMNNKALGYIPFAFVGTGGRGECVDEPPLIDLVDQNIAHYQTNADYRHGLHYTALPTLFLAGVTTEANESFYLGGSKAITAPDPNARGMFIEFTGAGLGAIAEALKVKTHQMAVLGARMIADETRSAVETLGATQIKRAGEYSILSSIIIAVSEAMEWALGIFAEWAGAGGEISYQINREFSPTPMDAQTLTAMVGAWHSGAISEAELFNQLQVTDVIDGHKTLEEHQEEIAATPAIPAPVIGVAA